MATVVKTARLGVAHPSPPPWIPFESKQGSGTLISIGVADARCAHYFKVNIDGSLLVEDLLCVTGGPRAHNSITIMAPFSRLLEVWITSTGGQDDATYWLVYDA